MAQTGIDYLNALHPTPSVRFEYEADYPRLSSMTDGHGLTRYQYVPAGLPGAGLLARESGPSVHDVIGYTYDALGRAQTRTVDGEPESHTYDALGRLAQHTNLLGAFTTTYLGETAQPALMSVAGVPFQVRYQYEDNLGDRRLKAILNETVVDGVSHPVDAFTFTTSPEGLILSRTENDGSADGPPYGWHHGWQHGNGAADGVPGSSHPNQGKSEGHGKGTDNGHTNGRWAESDGITTQFGHDGALRLTQATGGTTESYVYDPASNLTQLIDASVSQSISVNQLNEIQTVNAVPYVYDASGNLLDDGARTCTWDAADRLLSITDKATGHVSGFAYDGLSRRVRETETDVGGLHSEAHLLWCGQSLCEKRAADDSVLARYFPEGEWRPGQPLLYVRDQVGSVVAVVDASGAVVGRLRYSSYGNQTDSEGVLPDFRYAGLVHHQASGLELATYRAYAADVGRWLSRDPIRESGGLNLQAYATSLPNEAADPAGLYTEVIMLEPKGYSVEGFGHIAVRIDDKAFSFAPGGGMLELPFDLYIGTQGRNAVGVVIALTPSQENELRQALRSYVGKTYWPVGRNCTRPIQAGLSQLGLWNEHDQLPSGLVADLAKSPLAVAEAFYPGRGDNHASLPQPYSVSNDSLVATPIWVWALALSGL